MRLADYRFSGAEHSTHTETVTHQAGLHEFHISIIQCIVKDNAHRRHGEPALWLRRLYGGVLRITQKGHYVRTTIAMAPLHHLPIDACTDSNACIRYVGGNLLRCGPDGP